jgi:hypothetical protein
MDNFERKNPSNQNLNKPVSVNSNPDKQIPLGADDTSKVSVSHSPLNLGGGSATQAPKIETPKIAPTKPVQEKVPANRITGVKTFFTKLHPGAMEFLDEQITNWLKENPGVAIRLTNTTTGEVQAKKTEPNIIITVWY